MSSRFRGAGFSGGNTASFARENAVGGSRPVGAGKGAIRSGMDSDSFDYSLSDGMAARRADKALAGATTQPAADNTQPAPSRLDASPTPGLDAQQQNPISYGTKQGRMAEQAAATVKSSMSGAFGERAKEKTKRDMTGTVSKFRDQGMAMMGRASNPAMATKTASVPGAAKPPALQGRALAERNIATKGFQGAAADYFARSNAQMLAKQAKVIDTAMAKPQAYQAQPTAKPTRVGITAPAASGARNPLAAPARPTAPTMTMGSTPKPANVAQSDAGDYGDSVKLETPSFVGSLRKDAQQVGREAVQLSNKIGSTAKNAAATAKNVAQAAGGMAARTGSQAVKTGQSMVQNTIKIAGDTATAPAEIAQRMIPGATGEYVRGMDLPKKARSRFRRAVDDAGNNGRKGMQKIASGIRP